MDRSVSSQDCCSSEVPTPEEDSRLGQELDLEHRQLLSIFDSIDEAIYISDPDTHDVLYANHALRKHFGDVVGEKCYVALQGLDSVCSFCTNDRIFGPEAEQPYIWEFQNKRNKRWYRCIDRAIRWPDGRMVRCEVAIDITDRKRAEEASRRSEALLRGLMEQAPFSVAAFSPEGRLLFCNKAAQDLFGVPGECHDEFLRRYLEAQLARPGFEETLAEYDVNLVLTYPDDALSFRLECTGDWEEVYKDDVAVIWVREEP